MPKYKYWTEEDLRKRSKEVSRQIIEWLAEKAAERRQLSGS